MRLDTGLVGLTGPRLDPGLVGLSLSCLAVAFLGLAVPSRRFPSLLSGFSLLPFASRAFPLLPVRVFAASLFTKTPLPVTTWLG